MMTVKTYIAPSKIHGTGVFAGEAIPKGKLIWSQFNILDQVIDKKDAEKLPGLAQEYLAKYGYVSPRYPDKIILEFDNGRFMNHSDHPNTDFTREEEGYALVDIAEGEELTCNYQEFCIDHNFVDEAISVGV